MIQRIAVALAALLLAGSLHLGSSVPASAGPSCDIPSQPSITGAKMIKDIVATILQFQTETAQALTELQYQVILAIGDHADILVSALKQQTKDVGDHLTKQADLLEQADVERQTAEIKREMGVENISPNACAAIAAARGAGTGTTAARVARVAYDLDMAGRTLNAKNQPSSQGSIQDVQARYTTWLARYCDEERHKDVPGCKAQKKELVDADVKAGETLMLKSSFKPATGAATPEDEVAAVHLVHNLTQPVAPSPVFEESLRDAGGRAEFMRRRSNDSRVQMAQTTLNKLVANRKATMPMGDFAKQTLKGAGAPQEEIDAIGTDISKHQLLEVMTSRRFEDPRWYTNLYQSEADAGRELNYLAAWMLQLQWQQYELLEHIVGIEATELAMEVERTQPQLPQ